MLCEVEIHEREKKRSNYLRNLLSNQRSEGNLSEHHIHDCLDIDRIKNHIGLKPFYKCTRSAKTLSRGMM